MPRPTSIRIATLILYLQLALSVAILALNVRLLISPPADQADKIAQLSGSQVAINLILLMIPAAAAVVTLWAVRRKKRMSAIVGSFLLLLSGSMISQPMMFMGVLSAFLLISRSARLYFTDMLPSSGPIDVTPSAVEDAETSDDGAKEVDPQPAPVSRLSVAEPVLEIREAGPDDAETVHALMMEAFEEYRAAVPPSSALDETADSVRENLANGQGAAILYEDDKPAAMVRYSVEGDTIQFFRLSVPPARRRRGYAKRLVRWIEQLGVSKGLDKCRCKVRQTVQNNVAMYQDMGYEIVDQELVVRPQGSVKALTMEKKLGV
ncbi:GNAT family N-acetyltransferase [Cohnella caldifontis]|uniref:GNAT family N-acetyltransferase n=1 Tax=Cohnella caldifontis TaxID=3027471 RepID=UPI0023EC2B56|nr:GNAT family N-acetyltransferase [Cohnella sp. YIM B05605]